MKRVSVILVLLLGFGAVSFNRQPPDSTVVLIVRHAEKASDAEDGPLTEAGAQRARALVRVADGRVIAGRLAGGCRLRPAVQAGAVLEADGV